MWSVAPVLATTRQKGVPPFVVGMAFSKDLIKVSREDNVVIQLGSQARETGEI
jgi:hypothetical protein